MASSFSNIYEPPVEWSDPELLPKRQTTFDTIAASTSIPWVDPATLPKKITTHDLITERVTIQAPRNKVGDTQVYGGQIYTWAGESWVLKA
jgi:hypothetical protein